MISFHFDMFLRGSLLSKTLSLFDCLQLLGSAQSAMPLRLQYDLGEPNSAWNWLERWTTSHAWGPLPQTKRAIDSKSKKSKGKLQNVDNETARSKRSVRRVSNNGTIHSSESGKSKRNPRKLSNYNIDPTQEQPQNEVDKVKRNLRKVSDSIVEINDQIQVETEKPNRGARKTLDSPTHVIQQQCINEYSEKMTEDKTIEISTPTEIEITATPVATKGLDDMLHDIHPAVELPPLESQSEDENISVTNGDSTLNEDQVSNENQKNIKRRASFPAKQENLENGSEKTPKLPSYMQATESAKAKLRGQSSPRFGQDVEEKIALTRRHSLSSATNGKLSSVSPRTQRFVQASGKGGIKNDRSHLSSKDGKKKK